MMSAMTQVCDLCNAATTRPDICAKCLAAQKRPAPTPPSMIGYLIESNPEAFLIMGGPDLVRVIINR